QTLGYYKDVLYATKYETIQLLKKSSEYSSVLKYLEEFENTKDTPDDTFSALMELFEIVLKDTIDYCEDKSNSLKTDPDTDMHHRDSQSTNNNPASSKDTGEKDQIAPASPTLEKNSETKTNAFNETEQQNTHEHALHPTSVTKTSQLSEPEHSSTEGEKENPLTEDEKKQKAEEFCRENKGKINDTLPDNRTKEDASNGEHLKNANIKTDPPKKYTFQQPETPEITLEKPPIKQSPQPTTPHPSPPIVSDADSQNAEVKKKQLEEIDKLFNQEKPIIKLPLSSTSGNYETIFSEFSILIKNASNISGKYNEPFGYELEASIDGSFKLESCEGNSFITQKLGLSVERKKISSTEYNLHITGTPNRIGYNEDEPLTLIAIIEVRSELHYEIYKKSFYIAPDPITMWKDLPVPENIIYPTPNEATSSESLTGIQKEILAASIRGRSHSHEARPRDDNFFMVCNPESGWNVIAVSDGAGRARFARKGSQISCETSVKSCIKYFSSPRFVKYIDDRNYVLDQWKQLANDKNEYEKYSPILDIKHDLTNYINHIIRDTYTNIYEEAKSLNNDTQKRDQYNLTADVSIKDYHSTLLFLAFKEFFFGYLVISFWIGDGAMALYRPDNKDVVNLLGTPDSGEYAGQTRFITMNSEIGWENIQAKTHFTFVNDFEALILATDGVTDPLFPSENSLTDYEYWHQFYEGFLKNGDKNNSGCPEIFQDIPLKEKEEALKKWLNFYIAGYHDDRTIVIVKQQKL
ncbi:MAG: protein phosphatase 2C domain-containing protein, partial [Deltaproteobacteria bacterium]|nr:protein phosphatase 2C domain-containing protein [Deltaproteobacteria bacterium]